MATPLFPAAFNDASQRALDADLYSTVQQTADADNIAATGNLNIGQVLDYDAAAEARAGGVVRADDAESLPESAAFIVPEGNTNPEAPQGGSAPILQTTTVAANPAIANPAPTADYNAGYAPVAAEPLAPVNPAAPAGTAERADTTTTTTTDTPTSSTSTSTSDSHNTADSHNVTNVYNNTTTETTTNNNYGGDTTVTNNVTNNYGGSNTTNNNTTVNNNDSHDTTNNNSNNTNSNNNNNNGGTTVIDIGDHHGGHHHHGGGDPGNPSGPPVEPPPHDGGPSLIDISDLGGDLLGHHSGGNDGNLIDLDLDPSAGNGSANDNDILDIDLGGILNPHSGTTAGSDNDLIDLDAGLFGHDTTTATSDNDLIDLNLLHAGSTGGGSDNDLLNLNLLTNGANTGTASSNNDGIDLNILALNPGQNDGANSSHQLGVNLLTVDTQHGDPALNIVGLELSPGGHDLLGVNVALQTGDNGGVTPVITLDGNQIPLPALGDLGSGVTGALGNVGAELGNVVSGLTDISGGSGSGLGGDLPGPISIPTLPNAGDILSSVVDTAGHALQTGDAGSLLNAVTGALDSLAQHTLQLGSLGVPDAGAVDGGLLHQASAALDGSHAAMPTPNDVASHAAAPVVGVAEAVAGIGHDLGALLHHH